jgi:hypothetical protein
VTKRGYRFIAPVTDEATGPPSELAAENKIVPEHGASEHEKSSRTLYPRQLAIIPVLAVVAVTATAGHYWFARTRATRSSLNAASIAVLLLPT